MARPKAPASRMQMAQVSGNPIAGVQSAESMASLAAQAQAFANNPASMAGSSAIYRQGRRKNPKTERNSIAKPWQIEAYRHVRICGEARYAVTLFSAIAGRAEIGISEPQAMVRRAAWVTEGEEVAVLSEIVPTVRERSKLIRTYMLHRKIAGECYLIARERVDTDPGFIPPPDENYTTWSEYLKAHMPDVLDPDTDLKNPDPNKPIWEIVAVTELQKVGDLWRVRHENGNWLDLSPTDPVIRMWDADPENRMEAWSPMQALLPTLREIEWLTGHIFRQVRSRLMSSGVWFVPDTLTFPPPPPDSVEGGAEAIAAMNEAEQFMMSLAASGTYELDIDDVNFPTVVMADPIALAQVDQSKLIQFWSEIDDKAMILRSAAVQRFALGWDLPPEQVLGASGLAVTNSGGSAGSVNHWGVWANEEQTISNHVEPALDDFVGTLTTAVIRTAVPDSEKVVAYDTASLRSKQDRSKESIELYDRGIVKGEVVARETGFDPENDMMDDIEFKKWLLVRVAGGSATPEQVNESLRLLGVILNVPLGGEVSGNRPATGQPGRNEPRNLDGHPVQGPPTEQHDHTDAPFSASEAAAEVLVLRALEKAGNVLLNSGKRGRDKDRTTPPHLAHVGNGVESVPEFDFSLASTVYGDLTAEQRAEKERQLAQICRDLYATGTGYTREALIAGLEG